MQKHLVVGILNGDDIGHEIVPAAVEVTRAAAARTGLEIDWRPMPIGRKALDELGTTLPAGTLETLSTMDGFILGPIGHQAYPKQPGAINPHPIMRKHFNLFANVRPTRSFPGLGAVHEGIDLVIVRENNEGFQPDRNVVAGSGEFRPTEEVTISVRVITRTGSSRVARAAFEIAQQRRKRLTLVHKNTVFKLGCGMFVEECRKVAEEFPDVTVDEVIVDTMAMRLIRDPQSFDTVVTTNMFGDILTDEAAGLVGGLGMAPGLCIGDGALAMAQATHGSAPDIAGQGIANPFAMIESARMMIEWLGHNRGIAPAVEAARLMKGGIEKALADPATRTRDIRGTGGTNDMTRGIVAAIEAA
ncbi:isocitrate/isopropylmalate dehydrogenase family protein [Mangrovibrevibacter kandeliae]|uniref:isocitrate/isopropylmalate dehydrogenase family protein n=1 Tax=Mangrovibrevibacter kandeliae TaxID=2968473 RepID=UPI00211887C2|nr:MULTISPECIES: isocitrate/isopropylmalate dehydrogenase family protein [unclassified Aurantimonas]MCQ8781219.1 isocitrate/isopropylmalate dehydrogenase family protein [Aurantimonas sp. CSK15Z-1]MCW4113996.1 isocitrate/isopropylmalate dehydrogenase family protein [Aurantimonas sp. MSK8Z-1]